MMKNTWIIAIVCLLVLLLSQVYWLHVSYASCREKDMKAMEEAFRIALDKEMLTRFSDKPKDLDSLKFTTIRIHRLDTLYNRELGRGELAGSSFRIALLDAAGKEMESVSYHFKGDDDCLRTGLIPIGTKGKLFARAEVEVALLKVVQRMLCALLVSVLVIGVTFFCVGRQLWLIRRTRRQLKEREESLYGAVHDLKRPLNGVFGILDFMQQQAGGDKMLLRVISESKRRVRQLVEMIESMLADRRCADSSVALQLMEVDLPRLIGEVEQELASSFANKHYVFHLENPEGLRMIRTDRTRLERILCNLLENALKYADEGVAVRVRLSRLSVEGIRIAIEDTGWGIPASQQKRIGRLFFRVKQAGRPGQEGFGMGLNSVRRLVRQLGGSFSFNSREGKGSTFFITLPADFK